MISGPGSEADRRPPTSAVASAAGQEPFAVPIRGSVSAPEVAFRLGLPAPTPEQRQVIEAPLTSMLVVAGAGSGKTETMAARVVWLTVNGMVDPSAVLGLTFTRKAAGELRERITHRLAAWGDPLLGPVRGVRNEDPLTPAPDVQTYHSYAAGLLAEYGMLAGLETDARLLSPAGSWQLAHEVVSSYDGPMHDVDLAPSTVTRAVLTLGDELSEQLCDVHRAESWCADLRTFIQGSPTGRGGRIPAGVRRVLDRTAARHQLLGLVEAYREAKQNRGCLDFSDQLALAARLVTEYPWIGARERSRRELVLLDEFQDTSAAQLAMLRAVFGPGAGTSGHQSGPGVVASPCQVAQSAPIPVIAVGDPHQSIYGWRGAGADTLGRFAQAFAAPGAQLPTQCLSTSWRNAERILTVANRIGAPLIGVGEVRVRRLVPAPAAPVGRVDLARCIDEAAEADLVAQWIAARRGVWSVRPGTGHPGEHMPLPSAAVLCRRREQIPVLAAALRARGVPVEEVGVGGLISTPEVAHLIAALTATHDPSRNDAMLQLLMRAPIRLGAADLDAIGAWARELIQRRTAKRGADEPKLAAPRPQEASLAEAVATLPTRGWRGPEGERLGDEARRRLRRLAATLSRLSSIDSLPLPDLMYAAERILGLEVEVSARPSEQAAAGARHLRRFAEVAADFATRAPSSSLGALLAWLEAAQEEEDGLPLDPGQVDPSCVQVCTVHAAKGLEWDVVAVPGLIEGSFPSVRVGGSRYRDGAWTVLPPRAPGWTTQAGTLPYDLRADRDALPALAWCQAPDLSSLRIALEDFGDRNAQHQLEEERRLMYVATTRARDALLLTAPVWGSGATPRVTSRFLEEVRQIGEGRDDQGSVSATAAVLMWEPMPGPPSPDGAVAGGSDRRHSHGEGGMSSDADGGGVGPVPRFVTGLAGIDVPSWPMELEVQPELERASALVTRWQTGEYTGADAAYDELPELAELDREIAVLLAERDAGGSQQLGAKTATLRPMSASDLVRRHLDPAGQAEDMHRPVPRKPLAGGQAGRAWHRWIERYYRRGGLFDEDISAGDQAQLETVDPFVEGNAGQMVSPRAVRAFLAGPWAQRSPVALELPVDTLVGDVPVRGRIDAVFCDGPDRFVVVDWKTGLAATGEAAAAQTLQLAVYRTAYARLAGVPIDHVRACFCYAQDGSTVYPPLPDEAALEVFVAAADQL